MKQQVTPAMAAGIIGAVVVIGILIYFIGNRTPAPRPQNLTPADKAVRGLSPDQQVRMRMQQMQQGQAGGQ